MKSIPQFPFCYQEPWNQDKFEKLLIEWMIACDQPFNKVEKPEFIAAMSYGRSTSKFTLPKQEGIQRQIMKLGHEAVEEIRTMFVVRFLHCYFLKFLLVQIGFGRQNQPFPWCLDVQQLLCVFSHCSPLCHEWGAMWYIYQQLFYIMSHIYYRGASHWLPQVDWTTFRWKYGSCHLVDLGDLWHTGQS